MATLTMTTPGTLYQHAYVVSSSIVCRLTKLVVDVGGRSSDGETGGNTLTSVGVSALVDVLLRHQQRVRVTQLRFHECQLGDDGVAPIVAFLTEAARLPSEIHLSHNSISTAPALQLIDAIAPKKHQLSLSSRPLWLRLEMNCIDTQQLLQSCRSRGINTCTFADACVPWKCSKPATHIHLPYFFSQRIKLDSLISSRVSQLTSYPGKVRARQPSTSANPESTAEASSTPAAPRAEPERDVPFVLAVLDTNAVLAMLEWDCHGMQVPLSFVSALRTPQGSGQVQFALLHTVSRELDGMKRHDKHGPNVRKFLKEKGLRDQCMAKALLVELADGDPEHARDCGLPVNDASILNGAYYLHARLVEQLGPRAALSVVLVTEDHNMRHWAGEWQLPCTSLATLSEQCRRVGMRDMASARVFLQCAGLTGDGMDSPLKAVRSQPHILRKVVEDQAYLSAVLVQLRALQQLRQHVTAAGVPLDIDANLLQDGTTDDLIEQTIKRLADLEATLA